MIPLLSGLAAAEPRALRETLPVQVKSPIGSEWRTVSTVAVWVVDWQPRGDEVRWTARLCALSTPPSFGAETIYPPAFVRAAPVRTRTGRLAGGVFTSGPHVERIGDADEDGDGEPGLSVTVRHPRVGEGQVHVRQQATVQYTGAVREDRLRGEVSYDVEQELLGATRWWLGLKVARRPAGPGTFEMVPIGELDCAEAAAAW